MKRIRKNSEKVPPSPARRVLSTKGPPILHVPTRFLPIFLAWLRSFLDENIGENHHQHLVVLTSRPAAVPAMQALLTEKAFHVLVVDPLSDDQVLDLTRKTLARVGENEENSERICELVLAAEYSAMKQVPIILTLLVHVLRKSVVVSAKVGGRDGGGGGAAHWMKAVIAKSDFPANAEEEVTLHQARRAGIKNVKARGTGEKGEREKNSIEMLVPTPRHEHDVSMFLPGSPMRGKSDPSSPRKGARRGSLEPLDESVPDGGAAGGKTSSTPSKVPEFLVFQNVEIRSKKALYKIKFEHVITSARFFVTTNKMLLWYHFSLFWRRLRYGLCCSEVDLGAVEDVQGIVLGGDGGGPLRTRPLVDEVSAADPALGHAGAFSPVLPDDSLPLSYTAENAPPVSDHPLSPQHKIALKTHHHWKTLFLENVGTLYTYLADQYGPDIGELLLNRFYRSVAAGRGPSSSASHFLPLFQRGAFVPHLLREQPSELIRVAPSRGGRDFFDSSRGGRTTDAVLSSKKTTLLMSKTQVFLKAVLFLLHQSAALKFSKREGKSHQVLQKEVEQLKDPTVLVCLSFLAVHAHEQRSRESVGWGVIGGRWGGMLAGTSSGVQELLWGSYKTLQEAVDKGFIGFMESMGGGFGGGEGRDGGGRLSAVLDGVICEGRGGGEGKGEDAASPPLAGTQKKRGSGGAPPRADSMNRGEKDPSVKMNKRDKSSRREQSQQHPPAAIPSSPNANPPPNQIAPPILLNTHRLQGFRFTHLAYQEMLSGAYMAAIILGAYKKFSRSPNRYALELFVSYCNALLTNLPSDQLFFDEELAEESDEDESEEEADSWEGPAVEVDREYSWEGQVSLVPFMPELDDRKDPAYPPEAEESPAPVEVVPLPPSPWGNKHHDFRKRSSGTSDSLAEPENSSDSGNRKRSVNLARQESSFSAFSFGGDGERQESSDGCFREVPATPVFGFGKNGRSMTQDSFPRSATQDSDDGLRPSDGGGTTPAFGLRSATQESHDGLLGVPSRGTTHESHDGLLGVPSRATTHESCDGLLGVPSRGTTGDSAYDGLLGDPSRGTTGDSAYDGLPGDPSRGTTGDSVPDGNSTARAGDSAPDVMIKRGSSSAESHDSVLNDVVNASAVMEDMEEDVIREPEDVEGALSKEQLRSSLSNIEEEDDNFPAITATRRDPTSQQHGDAVNVAVSSAPGVTDHDLQRHFLAHQAVDDFKHQQSSLLPGGGAATRPKLTLETVVLPPEKPEPTREECAELNGELRGVLLKLGVVVQLRDRLGDAWWQESLLHMCDFLQRENLAAFYLRRKILPLEEIERPPRSCVCSLGRARDPYSGLRAQKRFFHKRIACLVLLSYSEF